MQQLAPDAMDADAIVAARDAGEQRHDFESRIIGERGQRERAVLASTPAQDDSLATHVRPFRVASALQGRGVTGSPVQYVTVEEIIDERSWGLAPNAELRRGSR